MQALRAAARDGVDVRLLVPGASDIPLVQPLSRAGYRPLLEAGVRVFEWNGTMLHAKTAVADGRWARVGSTNLNIASWLGNCELDVVVEDEQFAQRMEADVPRRTSPTRPRSCSTRRRGCARRAGRATPVRAGGSGGSAGRAAAGALRIGNAVGAALTNHRVLGPVESRHVPRARAVRAAAFLTIFPRGLAYPLVALGRGRGCRSSIEATVCGGAWNPAAAPTRFPEWKVEEPAPGAAGTGSERAPPRPRREEGRLRLAGDLDHRNAAVRARNGPGLSCRCSRCLRRGRTPASPTDCRSPDTRPWG